MLVRGLMILWAMAATVLPPAAVYAAETAPPAAASPIESTHPDASPASEPVSVDPVESVPLDARPAGLNYKFDAAVPEPLPDGLRFGFARRPASASALRFSPAPGGSRPGWAFSGRAGPLRWLTPLDGEGGTTMRLGGRIADQPRTPGLGLFNMSFHYSFE
jgi:hypothetical protein